MCKLLKLNLIKVKLSNGSIVGDCWVGSRRYVKNGIETLDSNIMAYGPIRLCKI